MYWVSEICTGDGFAISEEAWRGIRFENRWKNTSWPRQQKPSSSDWKIWQQFLKKSLLYRGLRLRIAMGEWLQWDNDWEWYFSPSQECLFQYSTEGWKFFSKIHKRDKLPMFSNMGTATTKPTDLQRATIYKN